MKSLWDFVLIFLCTRGLTQRIWYKNQRSSEWGLWGGRQRGSVGAGGAMEMLLVSAPCHLPGWEMLGPLEGCAPPGGRASHGHQGHQLSPPLPGTTVWPSPLPCGLPPPAFPAGAWPPGMQDGVQRWCLWVLVHRSVGSSPKPQARPQGRQLRNTLHLVHEVGGHGASRRPAWQSPPTQSHLVSVGQDSRVQRPRCSVPAAPGALTTASPMLWGTRMQPLHPAGRHKLCLGN